MIRKVLLLLLFGAVFNGQAQNTTLTIIRGKVEKDAVNKIFLYQSVNGEMQEYASTTLDNKNCYAFAIPEVKAGFYYIGDNIKGRPVYERFYLQPGEEIVLDITQTGGHLAGKTEETKLLSEWQQLYAEISVQAFQFWGDRTGYVTFFPALKSFLPKVEEFKRKISTPDKTFNQLLSFVVDDDVSYAAINFLYTPRVAHPSKEERPDFYNHLIVKGKYCDTRVLQLGDGMRRVSVYAQFANWENAGVGNRESYLEHALNNICNDTLKGLYVVNSLRSYKDLISLHAATEPYKKYFVTDSIKAKYLRYESEVASFSNGETAYNFSYPDVNNKNVSLSDFKGKVVLVDTWATWCGPCKAQIPHLKKLEEELKEKNIVFVSISVDEEKDHQKWKDFVQKENLGGVQLFAKGWSEFAKYYKINAIPRFLVFDQDGKIVTVDAPRPSDPALKGLLLKLSSEKKLTNR